jgi:hypothetical protein
MFQILKQPLLIIAYNVIPFYVGKNWTNLKYNYNIYMKK